MKIVRTMPATWLSIKVSYWRGQICGCQEEGEDREILGLGPKCKLLYIGWINSKVLIWLNRTSGLPRLALVVKNPPASGGRYKRHGFNPWVREIPWRRARQPTSVFLPGQSHGERSLATVVQRVAKSWTWLKRLSRHTPYRTGNSIQYPVINHNGKRIWKRSICITESLCCSVEITTL